MSKLSLKSVAIAVVWCSGVAAQPARPVATIDLKSMPHRLWNDEVRLWTSPFHARNYSSHALVKYVVPFVALSGALIATDTKTANVLPNSTDQAIWSGRVSQLGAGYSLAGLSAGTFLVARLLRNDHAQEAGLLSLEALAHTQVIVFAVKQIANRQRPLDSDKKGGFWQGGNSFPSGHAASVFATATVFAYEYRHHIAVPVIAYSLAGLISASRVSAQRHWVSDIAVGSAFGFLIGRFTYKRNHDPRLPGSRVGRLERYVPAVGLHGGIVALSWRI